MSSVHANAFGLLSKLLHTERVVVYTCIAYMDRQLSRQEQLTKFPRIQNDLI